MFERITFNPNVMGGRACIRGMRITVSLVVNLVANGMTTDDILTWEEEGDELLVMGLRLREGIDPTRFATLSGRKIDPRQIAELKKIGFVETLPNGNLRVTDKGWPVLDAVVADLAA